MRTPRLDSIDVSIGVPPFTISGTIAPSRAEQQCAWEMLVELISRTSTAPLRPGEGNLREALTSLYSLFGTSRDLLRTYGSDVAVNRRDGNLSLAVIVMRVLNDILRPLLSTWHPLLEQHETNRPDGMSNTEWEGLWTSNGACRAELNQVRQSVRSYVDVLARIANAADLADTVLPGVGCAPAPRHVPVDAHARPNQGWKPRTRMVRWVSVFEGARIAWIKFRSKGRDIGSPTTRPFIDHSTPVGGDGFWFDYVADLGDAFDPTMAVAWQLGRTSVRLPVDPTEELPDPNGIDLPRGDLLVFGGDLIYPAASRAGYVKQLLEPYRMAFEGNGRAAVVAIPGNHDWMGGIEHFDAIFRDASKPDQLGGWRTEQEARYFAIKLPQGWWLWGMDSALDGRFSDVQLAYFEAAAAAMTDDDRLILCTPVPLWQMRVKKEAAHDQLRQDLQRLLGGRHIPVFLSGDSHYFAVYKGQDGANPVAGGAGGDDGRDEIHVCSGGGGAFLHPTHSLPARVPYERGRAEFEMVSRWPSPSESRAATPKVRLLRDYQSLSIIPLVAVLHGLLTWAACSRVGDANDGSRAALSIGDATRAVGSSWIILLALAVLVVVGRVTTGPNSRELFVVRAARRWGWKHGLALAATFFVTLVASQWLVAQFEADRWARNGLFAGASLISATLAYGVFLWFVSWLSEQYRMNDNLAYAAAHSGRYKHFVRGHIDPTGTLTLYAIGIDPIGKDWAQALSKAGAVPPLDPAGRSQLHYLWGHRFSQSPGANETPASPVTRSADSESVESADFASSSTVTAHGG